MLRCNANIKYLTNLYLNNEAINILIFYLDLNRRKSMNGLSAGWKYVSNESFHDYWCQCASLAHLKESI